MPHLAAPTAGTNRALLCKSTVDGLQVTQLNVDHTTENEDELFRFSQLGECLGFVFIAENIAWLFIWATKNYSSHRRINNHKKKLTVFSDDKFSAFFLCLSSHSRAAG